MKYYCKHCESEWNLGKRLLQPIKYCPLCGVSPSELLIIPDYETPEQHKARTGTPWPDNGPVWVNSLHTGGWKLNYLNEINSAESAAIVICVTGPEPPPDDWRPE